MDYLLKIFKKKTNYFVPLKIKSRAVKIDPTCNAVRNRPVFDSLVNPRCGDLEPIETDLMLTCNSICIDYYRLIINRHPTREQPTPEINPTI